MSPHSFRNPAASALLLTMLIVAVSLPESGHTDTARTPNIFQAILLEPSPRTQEVSTEERRKILAEKSALVLDVRPVKEYAISHIPGAVNVSAKPGVPISLYVSDIHEIGRIVGGNKAAPLILYCNGPFCGKSKRLAEELLAMGFTSVRRYQLGIPVWRALGGITEISREGIQYVLAEDRTAVFLDARDPAEFRAGTTPGARNLPRRGVLEGKDVGEVKRAKDDGRLPMEDHNTRIIVFGRDAFQARIVADALTREAFHNVSYFGGPFGSLLGTANPSARRQTVAPENLPMGAAVVPAGRGARLWR